MKKSSVFWVAQAVQQKVWRWPNKWTEKKIAKNRCKYGQSVRTFVQSIKSVFDWLQNRIEIGEKRAEDSNRRKEKMWGGTQFLAKNQF